MKTGKFLNRPEGFRCRFVIQFDKPFEEYGLWENRNDSLMPGETSGEGEGYGAYIKFKSGVKVQAKAASSYISKEQAVLTLNRELGKDKKLEDTKERGLRTWNTLLNRVLVESGTEEQMRTFYSCLFRANLFSRKFYEIKENGEPYYYSPYDGKIHDGYMYTDNGFWDTFRSQFPLTCILHPTMQGRYMAALLDARQQCGWLPSWSNPGETGGMSAWYVLSAMGIYSVCPGTDEYVIGSPIFRKVTITLENGNKFTILAQNNSTENVYIQDATLNGIGLDKNYITYSDINAGGELRLVMGDTPDKERCTSKYAAPFSLSKKDK